ncbi:nucleotidyltransferase family protein [Thermococcus sp. AM4]|uniref:nucleotidyltransferase family protein n=1 Tax=Thermococcus sp. (strain AM4) TaxID=246969 RepID=UPI00018708D6|nr:nucleotidyltransferase domain-containing protein [Thermococcus sp. AM4]EEB73071.1 nucleotidyltransferase, fused to N-terminal DNA-binding domain protein [Thermococcus sp. AM4]
MSKGLVSKTLNLLTKYGIAEKKGRRFVILQTPKTRELKRFLNFVVLSGKLEPLKEDWVLALGVYGSFARGENTDKSDLDVWILVEKPSILKTASLQRKIETATGREVDLLVLTPKRVKALRENDPVFYYSLAYGSMIIWGESLERIRDVPSKEPAEKDYTLTRKGPGKPKTS